jgi:hypothetical protein
MMNNEGDIENKKVNRGIILIHSSSVWTGSPPPGKFMIFLASSTSSCCNTVLILWV